MEGLKYRTIMFAFKFEIVKRKKAENKRGNKDVNKLDDTPPQLSIRRTLMPIGG